MNPFYESAISKMKLEDEKKEALKKMYHDVPEKKSGRVVIRWIMKPVIAACAGVAVVAATMMVPAVMEKNNRADNMTASGSAAENSFTITAYAKGLTKNGKVFATESTSQQWGMEQSSGSDLSYAYDMPLRCRGKNIAKVTYKLEHGFFLLYKNKDVKLGITGTRPKNRKISPDIGDEEGYFSSITMDYGKMPEDTSGKDYVLCLTDDSAYWSAEKKKAFKELHFDILKATPEETKKAMDFVMKDLGLTCTATYKDGSKETKKIKLTSELKSWDEVGVELPEKKKEREKQLFLTFSLS